LLSISQYPALYSIIGTYYGGDGRTTFALPDLRGRIPVGTGVGNNLSPVYLGENGGSEATVVTQHHVSVQPTFKKFDIKETGRDGVPSVVTQLEVAENWTPLENRQPYLGLTYIICTEGVYPQRP
jgi:microcystin-dependent protein